MGIFIAFFSITVPLPAFSQAPNMQAMAMAMANQAKNDPTTLITLNEYGSFIQAVSGPFSLPGVTSASFQASRGDLGDGDFSRVSLPLSSTFEDYKIGEFTPYAELTLSYTDQKQNEMWMEDIPIMKMTVRHNIKTTSIMTGFGAGYEPNEGLVIRPLVLLGWSRIEDNSESITNTTTQPAVGMFLNAVKSLDLELFDWTVEQLQYGPAIEAEYTTKMADDIDVFAGIRATRLHIKTLSTSTPGLEESNNFTSISGNIDFEGPTSKTFYGRDVRWQAFGGATVFDKDTRKALSFDWVGEIGAGILMDSKKDIASVESVGLKGSAIVGDGIDGWTIGISATF
jgi:hypothetical protein